MNGMWEEYEGKPRRHWIDTDYIFIVLVLASIIIYIIGEIYSGITGDHINTTQSYTTEISNENLTVTSVYTISDNNKYIVVKEIENDILATVKRR